MSRQTPVRLMTDAEDHGMAPGQESVWSAATTTIALQWKYSRLWEHVEQQRRRPAKAGLRSAAKAGPSVLVRIVGMKHRGRIAIKLRLGYCGVTLGRAEEDDAGHQCRGEAKACAVGRGIGPTPVQERGPSPLDRRPKCPARGRDHPEAKPERSQALLSEPLAG